MPACQLTAQERGGLRYLFLMARHAPELAQIAGDECEPLAACMRGEVQVVHPDGLAGFFQRAANLPVVL